MASAHHLLPLGQYLHLWNGGRWCLGQNTQMMSPSLFQTSFFLCQDHSKWQWLLHDIYVTTPVTTTYSLLADAPVTLRCAQFLSHIWLFATPWTVAHQAPLSMGFTRQEYWSRLPFPPPGDLPDPGIEPRSPALAGGFFTTEPPVHILEKKV